MKILLVLLLLSSCVSPQLQKLNPAVYYRNDICFEYETDEKIKIEDTDDWGSGSFGSYSYENKKLKFCGVGVLPYRNSYKLKITGYGKLHYFTLTTCHEEDTSENPDRGIFKKDGVVNIKYRPTMEQELDCPLFVSAYNKDQKHAWGVLAFENPIYDLQGVIKCNGYVKNSNGVGICQSRSGLIQEISFNEEVKPFDPVSGATDRKLPCPVLKTDDYKKFRFKLPPRECIYGFIGKESKQIFQFFTVGYEQIIIRE